MRKHNFLKTYRFSRRWFDLLVKEGVLEIRKSGRSVYVTTPFCNLEEGTHYVTCSVCGERMGALTNHSCGTEGRCTLDQVRCSQRLHLTHSKRKGVSQKKLKEEFGFSQRWVETLESEGVLVPEGHGNRRGFQVESVRLLKEGSHFIRCKVCGVGMGRMTESHLRTCCGLSLEGYHNQYPDAMTRSELSEQRAQCPPERRLKHSLGLRERFQGEDGVVTRKKISAASKRMWERPESKDHRSSIRRVLRSPEYRRRQSELMLRVHKAHPEIAEQIRRWHQDHPRLSAEGARNARRSLQQFSSPHRRLKTAMNKAGLIGFRTEYPISRYSIDEADPDLMIAVECDGCYFHGCEKCGFPGLDNVTQRAAPRTQLLEDQGWDLVVFKGHELQTEQDARHCVERLLDIIITKERHAL